MHASAKPARPTLQGGPNSRCSGPATDILLLFVSLPRPGGPLNLGTLAAFP